MTNEHLERLIDFLGEDHSRFYRIKRLHLSSYGVVCFDGKIYELYVSWLSFGVIRNEPDIKTDPVVCVCYRSGMHVFTDDTHHVWTHPEHRGNGYAPEVMMDALEHAKLSGFRISVSSRVRSLVETFNEADLTMDGDHWRWDEVEV